MCPAHGVAVDEGDHSKCVVELLACPEHAEHQRRQMADSRKEFDQNASEFGFEEKCAKAEAMPDGPERDALIEVLLKWMFPGW
jgi:hypothetical protein